MIRDTFFDIIGVAWPTLVIFIVILSVLRIMYLINNRSKFELYRELMSLLSITYILLMFELVTYKDINVPSGINLTPFKEIFRYELGSKLFFQQVLGNIIIFIPFGFFAAYYIKAKRFIYPFIVVLFSSGIIEVVQHYLGRSFDVDDIILNVVGGTIGYLLYNLMINMKKHLPDFLQKNWFYNVVIVLVIGIMVLYFLNYFEIWGL